jgi:CHAT domain-containing protein/Tfp pilus assembly protein PilF
LLYRTERQYSKAEPLFQRSLNIREKALGLEHRDVAQSLHHLALLYSEQGQYAKAEPLYQRALAIREKVLGADHLDVAATLNDLAVLFRAQALYAKAEPLYQRALSIREKALGPDHPNVALILNNLAVLYRTQGQYSKAEPLFQRSLNIREKALGVEHRDVAQTLNNLAWLYYEQAEYTKAEPLYDRALAIREKALGADHLDVAATLNDLAVLFRAQGQDAKAEPLYQRSLTIHEKIQGPDHPAVATGLNNLANLYRAQALYAKAEPLYQRALSIREKALGPDHPNVALILNNLAVLYRTQGQYAEAESLFQRTLIIRETALGENHPSVATTLDNLAGLYRQQGEYARAEPLYQRALEIREKNTGQNHPDTAASLNDLALNYRTQGQYAKAEPLFRRALAIREKVFGLEHRSVAETLNSLAWLYYEQGEYAKAEPLYLRALKIREKTLGSEHPDVAVSFNDLAVLYRAQRQNRRAERLYLRALAIYEKAYGPNHRAVATSLNNLAGLYMTTGQHEKVLPLLNRALQIAGGVKAPETLWRIQNRLRIALARQGQTELAVFFGKEAVNTIQSLRANLSNDDSESQRLFLRNKAAVYRGLAELLIDQGRLAEAQQILSMFKEEELFDFIRRSQTDDSRTTKADYSPAEESWQKRYHGISARLGSISSAIEELESKAKSNHLSPEEIAKREELRDDRKVAQQSFDRFLGEIMRELNTASPQRNREVGEQNLGNLRGLQDTLLVLGAGSVTLHYVMGESKLRMILTTPTLQIARESAVTTIELNRKIQEFRVLLSNPLSNPLPMAQELYKHLIGPVAADLRQVKAKTLMVSLDGTMRYIPLAALHDGNKYVIEEYRVALYTEAAKDKLKDHPLSQWRAAGLGLTRKVAGFSQLAAVKEEIEGIIRSGNRGVLPGDAHFDMDFTAKRLRDALDKSYPVLHIASHFVFRPGNESNSFLLLGDGNQLSLRNIKEDDYRFRGVDLITLSACETAVGGGYDANGLEIEGFGALAQKQGAKSVIATLWQVADVSTGLLMQNLYRVREESQGMTKVEALRESQLKFLRGDHPSYRHPFFWAPFILMGNWL